MTQRGNSLWGFVPYIGGSMNIKKQTISESDLKYAVAQYLEYGTNQGKWYADRLNSGAVYVKRGDMKYYQIIKR